MVVKKKEVQDFADSPRVYLGTSLLLYCNTWYWGTEDSSFQNRALPEFQVDCLEDVGLSGALASLDPQDVW